MASSCPSPHARFSFECRPKLLKDFLQDDSPSYSSNTFRSHHQKASNKSKSLRVLNLGEPKLMRSKSSRAASATISAFHKVIHIVKFLPFTSVKSPSILPRSISRKLSRRKYKKNENDKNHEVSRTIKVKDILRWKSSRDLAEEKSTPLDHNAYSPYRCTTTTTSKRSSWCDTDFTAEELPCWCGEIEEGYGKRNILEEGVGDCCMGETKGIKLDPKESLGFDENEQHSPVSVLESPFRDDHQKGYKMHCNNITGTKSMFMQRIHQEFESPAQVNTASFKEEDEEEQEIEEKANEILIHLKETNLSRKDCEANGNYVDQLLLDFFVDEMIGYRNLQIKNFDESEIILMREAQCWMNGEYNEGFEWEIEDKREAYIKDMQRLGRWNYKCEEEKQDLTLELEFDLFNDLIHEVLADHFAL